MTYGVINPVARCANNKIPTVRPAFIGDFMIRCTAAANAEFKNSDQ
jgi:hypothetical protein